LEEEDTQPLEKPIIEKKIKKEWEYFEKEIPETTYTTDYLKDMMDQPDNIRNVAVIGHLHHGKTYFIDMFVKHTHKKYKDDSKELRYTDNRIDEQKRGISVKSRPISFLLEDLREKSYLFNIIDTPGHVNFVDETCASLRLTDGAVILIDCVEGITKHTETLIKYCLIEGVEMVFVINKIDRLIIELKLPPNDAYLKLKYIIAEINKLVESSPIKLKKGNLFT